MYTIEPLSPSEIMVRGDESLPEWRESLAVRVPGYEYTPQFRTGKWDGFHRPGKWCRRLPGGVFEFRGSRGLLHRLVKHGKGWYPPEVADELQPSPLNAEELEWLRGFEELRDYQARGVAAGLMHKWGRMALATNAGKGAMIALLAERLARYRDTPTLILCDEIAVFNALLGEIEKWAGIAPGRVESGVEDPPEGDVVLAMVPTLAKRLAELETRDEWREWVAGFPALLLDEADKAGTKTWNRILRASPSEYRLGFSGTFARGTTYAALTSEELLGPVLVEARNLDLVERGISARPTVHLHRFDAKWYVARPPANHWWTMSGPERRRWVYEHAVVHNEDRHAFVADLIRPGVPTCVIVNRVAHGEELEDFINARGRAEARFLSGSDSKATRTDVLDQFSSGELNILIATKILDRGTNRLGRAVDLIFASGEGSKTQSLQRIGRGLRRKDGKPYLILRDIIDVGHKYLHTAVEKRVRLYNAEGFDVVID